MSMERVKGEIVFTCDECDDVLETETDDFEQALAELREADWKPVSTDEGWIHLCDLCRVA